MRFLEFEELLVALPAEESAANAATDKLSAIFERVKGNGNRLHSLTKSGHLKTASVSIKGKSVAVFWYRTEQERLIVDTLVSVANDEETLPAAIDAMEKVAAVNGCTVLEGTTSRKGLAEALAKDQWYPVGITLRKDI